MGPRARARATSNFGNFSTAREASRPSPPPRFRLANLCPRHIKMQISVAAALLFLARRLLFLSGPGDGFAIGTAALFSRLEGEREREGKIPRHTPLRLVRCC